MALKAQSVRLRYGAREVLKGVSLTFDAGEITAIIGPNGSGKSTFLSVLSGLNAPSTGKVELNDRALGDWSRRDLARQLALLPQSPSAPDEIRVRDLVSHGRFAHRSAFAPMSATDHAEVDDALSQTGTSGFVDRSFAALSGGERQRVWIALALAQTPRWLLLDEPTSFLDLGHQYQVLQLVARAARNRRMGVVMVLHDVEHAARFADRVVAIADGQVAADGPPREVIDAELITRLYNLPAEVSWLGQASDAALSIRPMLSDIKDPEVDDSHAISRR